MTLIEPSKITKVEAKINRLKSQRASLMSRQESDSKRHRMQRTRTLIQLGGMLTATKIPERFNISSGDELQTEIENQDKAAMLMGLLLTVFDQLPNTFSDAELTALKNKGIKFMRTNKI